MENALVIANQLEGVLGTFDPENFTDREVMRLAAQLVGAVQALSEKVTL